LDLQKLPKRGKE